ncbi:hypothetical protein CK203_043935 [Vitis vinifera]|uniref:Uncharacterized protein n=1 Tax=Vitis vinifera TaxID=29760 RepID=A0A438HTD3_VITVI|nr:hypothetical protein CK203_043935 [Vitis vinifera]
MTYSLPAFSVVIKPSFKHSSHKRLQVRAQSYRDEGRSSNMVDANLRVLKERIDVVRMKERLRGVADMNMGGIMHLGMIANFKRIPSFHISLTL